MHEFKAQRARKRKVKKVLNIREREAATPSGGWKVKRAKDKKKMPTRTSNS